MEPAVRLPGLLGETGGCCYLYQADSIDVIFIALPVRHIKRVLDLLDDLRDTTASIYYVPDIFVFDLIQARSSELNGIPVVAMCETPFYGYRGLTKRLIDIGVSLGFLICASPLLLVIALLVKMSSPGPAIFRQRRYGLDGHEIIGLQVSHHDCHRGRRADIARLRASTAASRRSGASCGVFHSMNCRNSSTCCRVA